MISIPLWFSQGATSLRFLPTIRSVLPRRCVPGWHANSPRRHDRAPDGNVKKPHRQVGKTSEVRHPRRAATRLALGCHCPVATLHQVLGTRIA